jgi:cobalt/nickel transport system ATP-binding protein
MPLIELDNITFSYTPEDPPVLKDFSLAVEAGECLAVTGDNGAGKTTLFRVLNGLSLPQKGVYRFDGTEITASWLKKQANAKRFHQRIGYLFQNPEVMLFNASVREEIAFGPRQLGLAEAETAARVRDCLALFGLEPLADKAPYHLSGGQKKQVALAAVLALNPEVLILDEPLAGLDRRTRERLLALLTELKDAGKTLIAATHDEALCEALRARVLALAAP